MAQTNNKTVPTDAPIHGFIQDIVDDARRGEALRLLEIFGSLTGMEPKLWGNIVGYGDYHYKYESGREGDFFRTGFAMRAKGISVYIMPGYQDYSALLSRLGKHKMGKSCLNINRLSDIDEAVLSELIESGLKVMQEKYPV